MCSRISRMSSSGRLAQISGESSGCVIFGIWLGRLWVDVWLVTRRRVTKVAYLLVSQSQSQRHES